MILEKGWEYLEFNHPQNSIVCNLTYLVKLLDK